MICTVIEHVALWIEVIRHSAAVVVFTSYAGRHRVSVSWPFDFSGYRYEISGIGYFYTLYHSA